PLVRAYLDLGRHLGDPRHDPKARAVYQRVLELDPSNDEARRAVAPPPAEEYVDLGALIFDDDEEEEASTRFVVPEEEPTGDEDRDFADMLAVFRRKVSENIATEDSSSHYDLGLAFMEMGLIDEAISEFQVALRGGANPVATLEVLGHCFVEKGQYAVAARVLERALSLPGHGDAELVGVVYQLGRCEEALGNAEAARAHYERVVALDIRFRDAAVRLDGLRAGSGARRF
ncbi:MAG: tetratricopeptide repeat protein, partial [Gemmatimonadota bacterium]|nr:tetratricopeptide repeat protein [Gemmatimonadota bacterium]